MKKLALAAFVLFACSDLHAAPRRQRQPQLQRGLRSNALDRRAGVQDMVLGFYVRQFRQAAELSPDVFAKALPFLEQFIEDRFEISRRRTRAFNQLRQAVNANSSEDEIKRLVRDLDAADADSQANQEKFFSNVDPLLNARQQAKVRILINMADNRIRQMLNNVQNPNGQNAPAPAQQD
jgi:hypothetical protein